MKTDLLEICENQTLNIGLKLFLLDKLYLSHLFKLHFGLSMTWTDSKMIWLRERERERLGKRDSERERGIKTERQADKPSIFHKIALINQIFTH